MPLPSADTPWPPKDVEDVNALVRKWSAWWSGDLIQLAQVYAAHVGLGESTIGPQHRSGLMQLLPRSFHGTPAGAGQLRQFKLHVPLASDIASTSADLLFGEPPQFVDPSGRSDTGRAAGSEPTSAQKRLDQFMDDAGYLAVFLEAAETCSALSGVYLRLGWDKDVADTVLIDAIPPDSAVPEFRSGRLSAVTFWRNLPTDDAFQWRHLERHEKGVIYHGLYKSGDAGRLGERQDLRDQPDTEGFAALVNAAGLIETGATGLACEYVPNMRPNRRLRGSQLGRSDFDAIEPVLDSLDEAWTSWMRDLRLGKARLMVPDVYLENQGRGKGSLFDSEQEIYEQINHLPGSNEGMALTQVQFAIRVAEHEATTTALVGQAVRGAGYSAQTFGESGDVAMTATEVAAKQSGSFRTRAKKINYWRPVLGRLMFAALQIQATQFPQDGLTPVVPDIEWPDGVINDPAQDAQTMSLLAAAGALSTRTKVETLHPDWDDKRVQEEVKLISSETAPPQANVDNPGDGSLPGGGPPPPTDMVTQPAGAGAGGSDGQPDTGGAAGVGRSFSRTRRIERQASRIPAGVTNR